MKRIYALFVFAKTGANHEKGDKCAETQQQRIVGIPGGVSHVKLIIEVSYSDIEAVIASAS